MRHGWKIRIEERKYFEEKKAEREHERVLRRIAMAELQESLRRSMNQMRGSNEIN